MPDAPDTPAASTDEISRFTRVLFWVTLTLLAVSCVVWRFTWPISPLLLISTTGWWMTRRREEPLFKAVASVLGPAALGLLLLLVLLFLLNVYMAGGGERFPHWLAWIERQLVLLRVRVRGLNEFLGLPVTLGILFGLALLAAFRPEWNPVSRWTRARKLLTSFWILIVTLTSFTFFGQTKMEELAQRDEDRLLRRYTAALAEQQKQERIHLIAAALHSELEPGPSEAPHKPAPGEARATPQVGDPGPDDPGPDDPGPTGKPAAADSAYFRDLIRHIHTAKAAGERVSAAVEASSHYAERVFTVTGVAPAPAPSANPVAVPSLPEPPWKPASSVAEWAAHEKSVGIAEAAASAQRAKATQEVEATRAALKKFIQTAAPKFEPITDSFVNSLISAYVDKIPVDVVNDGIKRVTRLAFTPTQVERIERFREVQRIAASKRTDLRAFADLVRRGEWEEVLQKAEQVSQAEYRLTKAESRRIAIQRADAQFKMGEKCFASGDWEAAEQHYKGVTEAQPPSRFSSRAYSRLREVQERMTRAEMEKIRSGEHAPLQEFNQNESNEGDTALVSVTNSTQEFLTVLFVGRETRRMTLAPADTEQIKMQAGKYEVAASVSDPNVQPFYGTNTFGGGEYSQSFYISSSIGGRGPGALGF